MSETLLKRLREAGAKEDDGILLVARGSKLSMNLTAADKHAWYISQHGYTIVSYASLNYNGPDIASAMKDLVSKGAKRIVVLPMFLYEGKSVKETIPSLVEASDTGITIVYAKPLGTDELLLNDMDRKIPEGW